MHSNSHRPVRQQSGGPPNARRGRAVQPRPRQFPWLAIAAFVLLVAAGLALFRNVVRDSVGETVAVLPGTHVSADTRTSYNSNPPTSGAHTVETAPWGVSTAPLPDISLVHNLEHGGIVLHYQPKLDDAQRQQLVTLAGELQRQDRKVVLAPRPENDAPITASAWGKVLKQQTFNGDELRNFFDANINRGPERVS
jgi:hypothetical protein